MMATKHSHYECVEFLLSCGADVDQRDVRSVHLHALCFMLTNTATADASLTSDSQMASVHCMKRRSAASTTLRGCCCGMAPTRPLSLQYECSQSSRADLCTHCDYCSAQLFMFAAAAGRHDGPAARRAPWPWRRRVHALRRPQCREGLLLKSIDTVIVDTGTKQSQEPKLTRSNHHERRI